MKNKIYKPKEFGKMINRSVITLRKWDRDGVLKAHRTSTNRRYYTNEDYYKVMGIQPEAENQVSEVILYARVSTYEQKEDLKNQIEYLEKIAKQKGYLNYRIITDIGSGLNYRRKGFNELLKKEKPFVLIISNKDRLIRFGYEWFETFIKEKGSQIIVANSKTMSSEEEMIEDLISIIHIFSCRAHGLRKYKNIILEDKDVNADKND